MESYFQDIEYHIINKIRFAKKRILIAVAWFTNQTIGEELLKKSQADIEIIVDDNEINRNSANLIKFQARGVDLTFVKDLSKNYYLMHNKFCVIDSKCVITGSYNWTKSANTNDENISILTDNVTAAYYSQEFRRIKDIKFRNGNTSITESETSSITSYIYKCIVNILKEEIGRGELKVGLIHNWRDSKIENKLRTINERVRNNLQNKNGVVGIYFELIQNYGLKYDSIATEREKILARDSFRKNGLDEVEINIKKQMGLFKIRAIKSLQNSYGKLMDTSPDDNDKFEKIFKILTFLNKEKATLAKELDLNII